MGTFLRGIKRFREDAYIILSQIFLSVYIPFTVYDTRTAFGKLYQQSKYKFNHFVPVSLRPQGKHSRVNR